MILKTVRLDELNPAPYNPRKDLQPGDPEYEKLRRSIEEFGYVDPIIYNLRENGEKVIIGGHQRHKVLVELGYEEIQAIELRLDRSREKALNLALNKIEGDWDADKLKELLRELEDEGFDTEATGFDRDEIDSLLDEFYVEGDEDDPYTSKIKAPVYEPKEDEPPEVYELFDDRKAREMIERIDDSDVPEDVKEFLRLAAHRHVVFDYAKIAEFYAHADPEVQELMEESALVIIDFNKAIRQGFVDFVTDVIQFADDDGDEDVV